MGLIQSGRHKRRITICEYLTSTLFSVTSMNLWWPPKRYAMVLYNRYYFSINLVLRTRHYGYFGDDLSMKLLKLRFLGLVEKP